MKIAAVETSDGKGTLRLRHAFFIFIVADLIAPRAKAGDFYFHFF
jgi:hypothetical protein